MPQILCTRGHCYSCTAKHTDNPEFPLSPRWNTCWIHITCTLHQAQIHPWLQLTWTTLLHSSPAGFGPHCLRITSPWKGHQVLKGTNSHRPGNDDHQGDGSGYQWWVFTETIPARNPSSPASCWLHQEEDQAELLDILLRIILTPPSQTHQPRQLFCL